jgi:hypothetical protein
MKTILIPNLLDNKCAIVDDEDYLALSKYKWRAKYQGGKWHIVRTERISGRSKIIYMRRQVLGIDEPHVFVKHKDQNTLDHRKNNLSVVKAKYALVYAR